MSYYTYILKSKKTGRYYTGHTKDLVARLARHNAGKNPYTSHGVPWELVYSEIHETRADAANREREIKLRKSSTYIETLVNEK